MPEQLDQPASRVATPGSLADRLRDTPGLPSLVAEAEATWRARAVAAGVSDAGEAAGVSDAGEAAGVSDAGEAAKPGWRAFEDSFPTFYEFTNRPR